MSNEDKKPERDLPPGVPRADDGTAAAIKHANGVTKANGAASAPQPVQQVMSPAQQAFLGHCQAVLETVVWGTITKFQGFGANAVAVSMCRAMGVIVGTMFHGSLADILNIRRQCRDAFIQGLTSSPSPHLYAPQPGPGDAQYVAPEANYKKVNIQ